jgi:RNA polymerase sigma-70 factor (ECF subfamily)
VPNETDELIPTRWTLIKRLKDWDDQEGWREFFDIYWTLIYGTARKTGLSHADAEEVVQNTVMEVGKRIQNGSFQPDPERGSFKAWLLQQTRWRIADQFRKRLPEEKARAHRPPGEAADSGGGTPTEERIPDNRRDPLELAWDEDWKQTLTNAALETVKRQVSARDLQVFVMLTFQGAAPERVAQLHEIERNHVDQIKHRVGKLFAAAAEELKRQWE